MEMWEGSQLSSSSSFFPPFPLSLSVESLSGLSMSFHLKHRPGYWVGARSFYFFPVCLLVDSASEPQHTGPSDGWPTALSVHYALVHKNGVIVPAVCPNNELSLYEPSINTGLRWGGHPSVSVPSLLVACHHFSTGLLSCPRIPFCSGPCGRGLMDHFKHMQTTYSNLFPVM